MTYQVLARKWRPKDFASLVGQEHVVRALTHALDGGRLHHAYLFTGTRGVGKTTLSRIFAKALNCETGVTATPCGVCRACREIDEGRFVDYVEMDAASNRGVDEMAALLERAVYAPVDARFKVYMIDEVHMLTNHAFNAMLKTLEEPPAHVKFILATTDPQKIPVTVLSRCLQFNLKQMPAGHIVSHLENILGQEQIPFEAQALRLLARAAEGSMRDALSLTDQAIAYSANQVTEDAVRGMLGALDQSYLIRLLDALVAGDGAAVLAVADEMALRSLSFSTALQDLASLLHRIGWAQVAPSSVLDEWPEAADLRRFAGEVSPEQVQLFYQIATIGRAELGLAPDEYAGFTMTLLRMLAFDMASGGAVGGASGAGPAGATGATGGGSRTGAAGVRTPPVAAASGATVETPAARAAAAAPAREVAAPASTSTSSVDAGKPAADRSGAADRNAAPTQAGAPVDEAAAVQPRESIVEAVEAPTDVQPRQADSQADSLAQPEVAADASASRTSTPTHASAPTQPVAAQPSAQAPAETSAPRRGGGASAALDVLRNAGMKVSTDRGRAGAAAPGATSAHTATPAAPAAQKPAAAPRVNVPVPTVPTPGAPRRPDPSASRDAAPAARAAKPQSTDTGASAAPPWDDVPPDDYFVPASADDGYFAPPDDHFMPVFDSGPDDVRVRESATSTPAAPPVDLRPLPAGIALNAIGFDGDWPALAASLSLTGIAYQLAFNSELTALDGRTLKLNVPVPQYADAAQVAKLKAALVERLPEAVDVTVEVGPARRTAAALDALARAERQREAEREIGADPFVQSLIRDFGASIVQGSIRPLSNDASRGAASPR
ncbi:DNA polymerase III subunit gamma/tau [Paraburkholderia phosphatilytica]|uniref:DNA polymerase III subunit gamma/tau n=1 Tax=Paraburkholderia phosphatilytica TaxID=2282883 RepID=UPI000E4ECCD6|nr:DNA polymerase III subunit gamma/tau [Paraburkholderia phosphatilytica]